MSRLVDENGWPIEEYEEPVKEYDDGSDLISRREAICEIAGVDDIGELSDGFHTFNALYEQRMILFAALVKVYKDKAWKSYRHEDGEYCFGGGWFIVGIDTPEGAYTYHYENKYWDMFDCADLPRSKHWDGHTEKDVTRLLTLPAAAPEAHVIKLRVDIDKNEVLKAFEAAKKNPTTILPRETTGWIPVAEKEPEENQKAICTNKHNEMMIGTYTKYGWMFPCYFETPIAWMPLPEPYMEEEDE